MILYVYLNRRLNIHSVKKWVDWTKTTEQRYSYTHSKMNAWLDVAKQCPWCARWCLKDMACNYIFACGLQTNGIFIVGTGCGRSWCWECGKKFCGQYMNPETCKKCVDARENHNTECCVKESGFIQADYCSGGHNSHCEKRW